ncbi:DNA processing protein DprA, partial [Lysobacter arseniciresistens ZS79]
ALAAGATLWRACGLTPAQQAALRQPQPRSLDASRAWLDHPDHHLLGWHHPDYPPLLRRSPHPPLALFIAGDPSLAWHPAVAIVGSRSPTPAGREHAAAFARALSATGLAIASGLAAGVDTAAHHATLAAGGRTLAVLGTGPDVPYPRSNTALHASIVAQGAIISEHLPGTGPRREHFPSRNRILAGLSLGTLVVEAAHRSGALITARLAAECGREVMALPGSIDNPLARGCHRLIRDGAALVEHPDEVVALLAPLAGPLAGDLRARLAAPTSEVAPPGRTRRPRPPRRPDTHESAPRPPTPLPPATGGPPAHTDPDHNTLWQALGSDPTDMDQLVARTGLTPARLSSILLLMELEGRVEAQHGRYHRSR